MATLLIRMDEELEALLAALRAKDAHLAVSRETGTLLYMLTRATNARTIVKMKKRKTVKCLRETRRNYVAPRRRHPFLWTLTVPLTPAELRLWGVALK